MAEVAGLVLGVAGLAGLIGLFKDTVDLFSLFADAHHIRRDYEILDTKLDVEKLLLLKWADRVRLLHQDHDERLDDAETQAIVKRVLGCIIHLLTDATELRDRYGLRESAGDGTVNQPTARTDPSTTSSAVVPSHEAPVTRVSHFRWHRFLNEFEDSRDGSHHRATIPFHTKARWVIRDKQKFDDLVQQLGHFISKIDELFPIANFSHRHQVDSSTEDLECLTDLKSLRLVREAAAGFPDLKHSTQETIDKKCCKLILDSLWFRHIDDRRHNVKEAHSKTLGWALDPPRSGEMPWDDLPGWLRSGSGIYWISGKAGSGKSTLMKYLLSQHNLHSLVSTWSDGRPVSVLNFFCSELGNPEQKTQEGLSRTLLYQILVDHQDLIPKAFPGIWRELQIGKEEVASLPSLAETRAAFDAISENSHSLGRFLVMIDGLDEFSGDCQETITFLQNLISNIDAKAIVSSRPIPQCVAAFSQSPKLRLQHLNRSDIEAYVRDVFESNPNTKRYNHKDPKQTTALIEDIVDKSSGVFLWVVLVCRVLLRGFADYDRFSELRRRFDELPPELEDMFQHMLGKIERRHREQGARLLRLCYEHKAVESGTPVYALGLALVCDYHLEPPLFEELAPEAIQDLCDELEGRLRSRCGGLLELVPTNIYTVMSVSNDREDPLRLAVVFMHRTVLEFLREEQVRMPTCLHDGGHGFDPTAALSLCKLHLITQIIHAKARDADSICKTVVGTTSVSSLFHQGLQWAARYDNAHGVNNSRNPFFDNLGPFLAALMIWPHDGRDLQPLRRFYELTRSRFREAHSATALALAIETGACNYVKGHPEIDVAFNCYKSWRETRGLSDSLPPHTLITYDLRLRGECRTTREARRENIIAYLEARHNEEVLKTEELL